MRINTGRMLHLAVLAAALLIGGGMRPGEPPSAFAVEPALDCSDPRGCPDLIVDAERLERWKIDRRTFAPSHCAVVEGMTQPGSRKLLRFAFGSPNLGPGDLVIGDPADRPELFEFAGCHGHYHFKEYADYRLWTPAGHGQWIGLRNANPDVLPADLLAAHPQVAAQMIAGEKRGFCAIDLYQYASTAGPRKYTSCGDQGISVGWADEYVLQLDGQWIDITDVPPGTYVLEAEVNAERIFEETSYANNSAWITVRIPVPRPGGWRN